jgi:hypothetical protein
MRQQHKSNLQEAAEGLIGSGTIVSGNKQIVLNVVAVL